MDNIIATAEVLQRHLVVYRRALDLLLRQQAQAGAVQPAHYVQQAAAARSAIARTKHELRALGYAAVDHPNDLADDLASAPGVMQIAAPECIYLRQLFDRLYNLALAGMGAWPDLQAPFTELYVERPLLLREPAPQDEPGALLDSPAPLADLARPQQARLVLLGEPGSGKSASLRRLALACAAQALGEPGSVAEPLAGWPGPAPFPLVIAGAVLAPLLLQGPTLAEQRWLAGFWGMVEAWLVQCGVPGLAQVVQRLLERGECVLLIDDIDRLPTATSWPAFAAGLQRLVACYPGNRYVLAGRSVPDQGLAGFRAVTFAPFEQAQTKQLIARWYGLAAARAGLAEPERVAQCSARLEAALQGDACLRVLAHTPQLVGLCVLAHAEGRALPAELGVVLDRLLYAQLTGVGAGALAGSMPALAPAPGPMGVQLPALERLAAALQERVAAAPGQPPALSLAELAALPPADAGPPIDWPALVEWWCMRGIIAPAGAASYGIAHPLLREHLAARGLAARPDFAAHAFQLRRAPHWHTPLLLAAYDRAGAAPTQLAGLIERLLAEPGSADLLLAAECASALAKRAALADPLRAGLVERLLACLARPELAIGERIAAGMLLGTLGDPRTAEVMPPLVPIAAGPFLLGADDGYDDEGPRQLIELAEFTIGVYPVTNQEYARFLAARPQQPPPHFWHDPRLANPACPVVGVTWHDANAYCAWLTTQLRAAGRLSGAQVVRLPLEAEWEKAASWDAARGLQRRFPWGDTWLSDRANTADGRGDWLIAPVGCYPAGASTYGLHDCIGNVWEWTASQYTSYAGAARPFAEPAAYVLRGSSCLSHITHARCTYRSRLPPNYWRNHLGFRLLIGKPI